MINLIENMPLLHERINTVNFEHLKKIRAREYGAEVALRSWLDKNYPPTVNIYECPDIDGFFYMSKDGMKHVATNK